MLSVKWIVTCLGGTEQVIVIVLSSSSWGFGSVIRSNEKRQIIDRE